MYARTPHPGPIATGHSRSGRRWRPGSAGSAGAYTRWLQRAEAGWTGLHFSQIALQAEAETADGDNELMAA